MTTNVVQYHIVNNNDNDYENGMNMNNDKENVSGSAPKSINIEKNKQIVRNLSKENSNNCLPLIVVLSICAALSFGIYHGATLIEDAQNYKDSATTEQCFVISREST
eukprot:499256_1